MMCSQNCAVETDWLPGSRGFELANVVFRAGVTRVFIGLENINPDNLAGAKKRQNKITEYRKMLLAWKAHSILTRSFPAGITAGVIARVFD
jgi:hypothetical protein